MNQLPEVAAAEKTIKELWGEFHRRHPDERVVRPGEMRCKFVLEPMVACFCDLLESQMVDVLERAVEENVWFCHLALFRRFDSQLAAGGGWNARHLLVRCVCDSTRRTLDLANTNNHLRAHNNADLESSHYQFGKLSVGWYDGELAFWEFEAVCSAMVLTQTTNNLMLRLEVIPSERDAGGHWWKWLAYAFFSRRARSRSAITHLSFHSIGRLSTEDAETFAAVLSSSHPEEVLLNCPRGVADGRDATLRQWAPIQWHFDADGRAIRSRRVLSSSYPIKYVRTFSDDGHSEWVNVLIPVYGRCQAKRSDLAFDCDTVAGASRAETTSLSIHFTLDTGIADGLPLLLTTIGTSLTSLSLSGRRELVGDDLFLGCCPNLLELSPRGNVVEAQLDFCECRKLNAGLPSIICNWHDVVSLSEALTDAGSPLAKCLHRLRIRLEPPRFRRANHPVEHDLDALLEMLEVNVSLEYLDVIVPTTHRGYITKIALCNKRPICRSLLFPIKSKLAFLSVVERSKSLRSTKERKRVAPASNSALSKLDHLIISNIFALAARPRRVICRLEREFGAAQEVNDEEADA